MSTSGERSALSKFTCVPGLIVTTLLSSILIYLEVAGTASHGQFFDLVNEHRASIQIIVQLLSHILGLVYILVLTTCLNYATRLQFAKRSVSLDHLQWWSSMCNLRVD